MKTTVRLGHTNFGNEHFALAVAIVLLGKSHTHFANFFEQSFLRIFPSRIRF